MDSWTKKPREQASAWQAMGMPPLAAVREGERHYLLLDAAQVDQYSRYLSRWLGIAEQRPLHGRPISHERADATPHLVVLREPSALIDHRGSALTSHCRFYGALAWLVSPLDIDTLAARLQHRLDAELPDEFACINRFFDARVVPHLHACLGAAQREAFFSVARQWWVVSHEHRWQSLSCEFQVDDPYRGPLHLDARQQAHMVDACYPYSVIEHFEQTDPELLDDLLPAQRYSHFSQALQRAAAYGIEGGASAVLYCTLTLTRGRRFDEEGAWPTLLSRVKRGEITLQQALKAQHD
ncbi:DUF4123 domain-containing protein [Roseateles sp. BYS87W]|uniref:DUF4123 domain-containing protein n=1 Tax=Pelomonas baiyunensis TaxID=3299026 RepID=A0ABW7H4B4_9BURK